MSCGYSLNNIFFETSESEFIGILCCILDIFPTNLPFDVEVTYTKSCLLLPKISLPWTLKNKLHKIMKFCTKLKQYLGPSGIEVIPVKNCNFSPKTYYIPEDFIDGFMTGYTRLLSLLSKLTSTDTSENNDTSNNKGIK